MGFIMRVYKSAYKTRLIALLFGLSFVQTSYASDNWLGVKSMSWGVEDSNLHFQAKLHFTLSPVAREALRSGIILYWDSELIVSEAHFFSLWNRYIADNSVRYSLSYNTLFNDYRVTSDVSSDYRRFSSLLDAFDYLGSQRHELKLLPDAYNSKCIFVDFNMSFDKESLPIPLRPIAYFSANWNLSTNARMKCE